MALVVFLRGVNVGGHRRFRPSKLAEELRHLDAVSIGAAGTFVFRQPVSRDRLRGEISSLLPFAAEIIICQAREIVDLLSHDFFSGHEVRPDMVRFVSVLSRSRFPRSAPPLPIDLPENGPWMVKILARENRFVVGLYRRHMKTIRHLGALDRLFGGPVTTRGWNTLTAITQVLGKRAT